MCRLPRLLLALGTWIALLAAGNILLFEDRSRFGHRARRLASTSEGRLAPQGWGWAEVAVPVDFRSGWYPVCDLENPSFKFNNLDDLPAEDRSFFIASAIGWLKSAWLALKLLIAWASPPKLAVAPAPQWRADAAGRNEQNLEELFRDKHQQDVDAAVERARQLFLTRGQKKIYDDKSEEKRKLEEDQKLTEDSKSFWDAMYVGTGTVLSICAVLPTFAALGPIGAVAFGAVGCGTLFGSAAKADSCRKRSIDVDKKIKQCKETLDALQRRAPEQITDSALEAQASKCSDPLHEAQASLKDLLPFFWHTGDATAPLKARTYFEKRMRDPVTMFFFNLPWGQRTQIALFFALALEGLWECFKGMVLTPPGFSAFYTFNYWTLTFRKDVFLSNAYLMLRCFVVQVQIDKIIGNPRSPLPSTEGPLWFLSFCPMLVAVPAFSWKLLPFLPMIVLTCSGWFGLLCAAQASSPWRCIAKILSARLREPNAEHPKVQAFTRSLRSSAAAMVQWSERNPLWKKGAQWWRNVTLLFRKPSIQTGRIEEALLRMRPQTREDEQEGIAPVGIWDAVGIWASLTFIGFACFAWLLVLDFTFKHMFAESKHTYLCNFSQMTFVSLLSTDAISGFILVTAALLFALLVVVGGMCCLPRVVNEELLFKLWLWHSSLEINQNRNPWFNYKKNIDKFEHFREAFHRDVIPLQGAADGSPASTSGN